MQHRSCAFYNLLAALRTHTLVSHQITDSNSPLPTFCCFIWYTKGIASISGEMRKIKIGLDAGPFIPSPSMIDRNCFWLFESLLDVNLRFRCSTFRSYNSLLSNMNTGPERDKSIGPSSHLSLELVAWNTCTCYVNSNPISASLNRWIWWRWKRRDPLLTYIVSKLNTLSTQSHINKHLLLWRKIWDLWGA